MNDIEELFRLLTEASRAANNSLNRRRLNELAGATFLRLARAKLERRFFPRILRLPYRDHAMLHAQLTSDVVGNVFRRLVEHPDAITYSNSARQFWAYVLMTARNVAIDYLRIEQKNDDEKNVDEILIGNVTEENAQRAELRSAIAECLAWLEGFEPLAGRRAIGLLQLLEYMVDGVPDLEIVDQVFKNELSSISDRGTRDIKRHQMRNRVAQWKMTARKKLGSCLTQRGIDRHG